MIVLGLSTDQWIEVGLSLAVVVVVLIVGRRLVGFVLGNLLQRITRRTKSALDDEVLAILHPTVYALLIVVSVEWAVRRLARILDLPSTEDFFFVLYFLVVFIFMWNLIGRLLLWYGQAVAPRTETNLDEQLFPFFRRIALILLSIIGLIVMLGHFEVNVSGLITTLGIGSLAIALAAQETLSDTISGFVIMLDRPFRIGDRIEIQDLNTWGDVVDIGLRSSRIRTRDNRMVIIPNSVIGKSLIVNHAFPDTLYRIESHIGVSYASGLEQARQIIIQAITNVDGVSGDHPVEALFVEFGDSAIIFRARWWIDSYVDTRRMYDRVNTAIYQALTQAGIELPFPTRELIHHFDPDLVEAVTARRPKNGDGNTQLLDMD